MSGTDPGILPAPVDMVDIRPLSDDTSLFRIRVEAGTPPGFVPGQFFQLSVPAGGEIPVSPAGAPCTGSTMEFCVKKVGHVTSLLHGMRPGDRLGIRGPFGRGFPLDEMAGKQALLLAGGLGIAPIRSLLLHLLGMPERFPSITLMYGAREPAVMLFRDELVALSRGNRFRLFLTVDFVRDTPPADGNLFPKTEADSTCTVGLLPNLLKGTALDTASSCVAVCGPPPLYRCLVGDLETLGFGDDRIFLSLERRMKCGMGRCCHCAIGQLFCCTDGPVFRYSDIRSIPGAL